MEDLDLPENFIARSSFGMEEKIAVNPEYRLVQLTHPLHVMPVKEAVRHPGNYYALIYRDPGNGNVRFINLSALFAYAFDQLAQQPVSMMQVAQRTEKAFRLTKESIKLHPISPLSFTIWRSRRQCLGWSVKYNTNTKTKVMLTTINDFLKKFDGLRDLSLLFLRLILAYGFYMPAINKWKNMEGIAQWFGSMNYPLPLLNAYLAGTARSPWRGVVTARTGDAHYLCSANIYHAGGHLHRTYR
ncbi:MAG: DoxX family membrane protein [Bacteroidales bacterium]|nr:DoxX family membrane protein [Bacteroidales bacterium]